MSGLKKRLSGCFACESRRPGDKTFTRSKADRNSIWSGSQSEKAIAVTGDRGPQIAADWLLSHCNDSTLDQKTCQEYILYLCPVGPLQKQLADYFEKTRVQCGWNGAHAYFPHITLCHFFKAEDSKIPYLTKALNKLQEKLLKAPGHLELEFFSQVNFIGLLVQKCYYDFLEEIVADYAEEIRKVGVTMDPRRQQLHMTLAYQYSKDQHERLLRYAKEIDLNSDVKWEFRLYSRDPRAGECEVREVTRSYSSNNEDELELVEGDHVLADPIELSNSKNGWCKGISTLTGSVGMFRIGCTMRTSETSTWTLHKSLMVVPATNMYNGLSEGDYDNLWVGEQDDIYNKLLKNKKSEENQNIPREPRCLFVMRHGERCDFALGRDWVDSCFNSAGRYSRINLNLPKNMLKRKNYLDFIKDCPLTEVGKLQARLTGEGLRDASVNLSHLYVSPALRCIQTAHEIVTALGLNLKICIEPSLFEWLGWYQLGLPIWFTPDELIDHGYAVDRNYISYMVPTQLYLDETVEHFYSRCADFTRYILKKHEHEDVCNILIVGHAGSLDVCTRQLLGKAPRSVGGFHEILPYVPCCSMCCCVEDPLTKKWRMKEPPVPPITHVANKKYNWKTLI
ncbi:protein UBASH3A homolog isoform X2 [Octopus sinensis]|uniref:Protein UBASH3A homolog isoform X2 n=1 Tax=Octopus sinensis TaxID=2607531 RepID=A0A7E6EVX7_9MOLL|nr:protein UBASH3A homolog isoform X2 [Octopus sinensis]